MRQEILALGGTEEDFKLLEGVDSDGEDAAAGEKPAVKATDAAVPANEIADFLKSIGLSAESAQEFAFNAEEEGDDEEEEEDDDVEDDSEYADDDDLEQDEEDDQQAPQLVSAHSASLARMLLPPNPRWYATELPSVDSILPQAPATIVTQAHTQAQVNKNRRGGKKKKQQQQQRLEQGGPATANATLVITPLHIKAVADVVREYTQSLLSDEHLSYDAHRARVASSDHQWFKTVIKSGTLTDRVGALSLAVRESPAHNLPYLEQLVSMCQKKNRREAMIAVDTVKDLVVGSSGTGLVPGDRKLRFFAEQPDFLQRIVPAMASDARIEAHVWLQHPAVKQHLVLWAVSCA